MVVADSLFDVPGGDDRRALDVPPSAPLAVRMRPATLDEVVGQDNLLRPGSPLRRLVEGSGAASVILYGPPGTNRSGTGASRPTTAGLHSVRRPGRLG